MVKWPVELIMYVASYIDINYRRKFMDLGKDVRKVCIKKILRSYIFQVLLHSRHL